MVNEEDLYYIEKVKAGDLTAYAFLVNKYKHMAYTISLKMLRNAEDAQDVAQEGFVKAFQQIKQFQGKSKFSTWLYTIVFRTSLSKMKEKKIATMSISEEFSENYSTDLSTPQLDDMQNSDRERLVKQAIARLPQPEALLVTLYYIGENSVDEIRDITGFSVPNIKIKLFRARKKLERSLKSILTDEPLKAAGDGQA